MYLISRNELIYNNGSYLDCIESNKNKKRRLDPFIINLDQNGNVISSSINTPEKTWDICVSQDYNNKLLKVDCKIDCFKPS